MIIFVYYLWSMTAHFKWRWATQYNTRFTAFKGKMESISTGIKKRSGLANTKQGIMGKEEGFPLEVTLSGVLCSKCSRCGTKKCNHVTLTLHLLLHIILCFLSPVFTSVICSSHSILSAVPQTGSTSISSAAHIKWRSAHSRWCCAVEKVKSNLIGSEKPWSFQCYKLVCMYLLFACSFNIQRKMWGMQKTWLYKKIYTIIIK